jgi:hypothetical protein
MSTPLPLPGWQGAVDAVTGPAPDRARVQAWLDAYVRAWQTYDPVAIADLWTDDAIWYRPFDVRAQSACACTAGVRCRAMTTRIGRRPEDEWRSQTSNRTG